MSERTGSEQPRVWQSLRDLKIAVKAVADVYVRIHILGGHYMRVSSDDFLEAIGDMEAVGDAHPYPRRYQFSVENGIVWVHRGRLPRKPAAQAGAAEDGEG